jgi:hypothetical protein
MTKTKPAVSATRKKKTKKRKTALIICQDRKQFWTTQTQFWQWVRDGIVVKTGEQPLTGLFKREHEELMVLLSNTVLNLAHPNHMREALLSRKIGMTGK